MAHLRPARPLSRGGGGDGGAGRGDARRDRAASSSGCSSIRRSTPPAPRRGREDLLWPDRFPVYASRRGGEYTYHGPGQRVAYAMLDLNRRGRDVRAYVWRLEEWVIRALAAFGVTRRAARRPGRRLGGAPGPAAAARRQPGRGQDRRDRRAHPPLGRLPRRRDQRRARPRAFRRHRALRHPRPRRDEPRRSRPAGRRWPISTWRSARRSTRSSGRREGLAPGGDGEGYHPGNGKPQRP